MEKNKHNAYTFKIKLRMAVVHDGGSVELGTGRRYFGKVEKIMGFFPSHHFKNAFNVLSSISWRQLPTHSNKMLEARKEMFSLTTHSTHFIYGYMASII